MPDSSGFGRLHGKRRAQVPFPCTFKGNKPATSRVQMYLDDEPADLSGGRENLGLPEEIRPPPKLEVIHDTLNRDAELCRPARRSGHHGLQAP